MQLPKIGKRLHRFIHQFPKVGVSVIVSRPCICGADLRCVCFTQVELKAAVQPITRSILKVELTITPDFEFNAEVHGTRYGGSTCFSAWRV